MKKKTPEQSFIDTKRQEIGAAIKTIRQNKGYSQQQLSDLLAIDRSTISKIETGNFNLSIDYLSKFAEVLDFDIQILKNK